MHTLYGPRFAYILEASGRVCLMLGLAAAWPAMPAHGQGALEDGLRERIEAGATTPSLEIGDSRVHSRELLRRFYPERSFAPLWVAEDGLTQRGARFVQWLAGVPHAHGLDPRDYHLEAIERRDDARQLSTIIDIELALTDAFVMLGAHFAGGRLDRESLDAEWLTHPRLPELGPLLERAADASNPGAVLETLLPSAPAYARLVERLAELRRVRDAGGWPAVEAGPALRAGDTGPRVADLARRLYLAGDAERSTTEAFDAELEAAVRQFQSRHGLAADGIVGAATLAALNTPVDARVERILVNLERWRWLAEDLGAQHVLVNIAAFRLDVFDAGESVLDMRVVVGTPYRRTPVFSDRIRYLVLNPSWNVPTRIAVQDKLPRIREDPSYLERGGYSVLDGWGAEARVIDPATVDWSGLSARSFPYRLRQAPGPDNALGRIKFMFPNPFAVYLHDTPARELFAETRRAFSSGCIRLEAPLDLAQWLLRDDPRWTRAALENGIEAGNERTITLAEPVPVHLLYWTAWVDTEGRLNFRDDIYGRDAPVLRELREPPPG